MIKSAKLYCIILSGSGHYIILAQTEKVILSVHGKEKWPNIHEHTVHGWSMNNWREYRAVQSVVGSSLDIGGQRY